MLIPESGKPADLKLQDIQTVSDCDRALVWLQSVLLDMERQTVDRGLEDREWLKKLRAAERATTNLRHRILEKRDSFAGKSSLHEAITTVAIDLLHADAVQALADTVQERHPHLAGFDLVALKA